MKARLMSMNGILPMLLLVVLLALAGCTSGADESATATVPSAPTSAPTSVVEEPPATAAPEESPTAAPEDSPTAAPESGECPTPDAGTQLIENREQGYCFLLPGEYLSDAGSPAETYFYVNSPMDVEHPRLFVHVEAANGRSAAQGTDEFLAVYGLPFPVERTSDVTLGGEPAEQLDGVPGQDIQRILFAVHGDRLYRLTFVPASEDAGAVYEAMLALYDQLLASFRFFPAEGEIPVTEQPPVDAVALCPEVPRPALALSVPGGAGFLILDPVSGADCSGSLPGEPVGRWQAVPGALFYTLEQDGALMVHRLSTLDNTLTPLDFTQAAVADALMGYRFAVSPDGNRIAWSVVGEESGQLWVAGVDGADAVAPLPEFAVTDDFRRAVTPVRFSADNNTLFYSLEPVGVGGSWIGFNGRYDNLYALRLGTEAPPELLFDCAAIGSLLCIGDFSELDGSMNALAYTAGNEIVLLNGAGETLNRIALEHDYVGYPTFGPGGDLVFYGADLQPESEGPPTPAMGYLYRVAPPTAPHELLLSDPGLLYPAGWLDGATIVVNYVSGDNWGVATAGLDGSLQTLEAAANAQFADVLR